MTSEAEITQQNIDYTQDRVFGIQDVTLFKIYPELHEAWVEAEIARLTKLLEDHRAGR